METSYHDKQAKQTDQSCDDGTAGREAGHLITVEMQGEIDMLFRHKNAPTWIGKPQVVHQEATHLATMTLGQWLNKHGYDCQPFKDKLSFNRLGAQPRRRISVLLRSIFSSTDSNSSTQARKLPQLNRHPFDVLLKEYACARGFGKSSFESLVRDIVMVISVGQPS